MTSKKTFNKSDIENLLSNPDYVNEAIRLIGLNQTADELATKDTHHQNGEGFSAAYARTGTRLYEFVTGIQTRTGEKKWAPKSLAHPVANKVFSRYISNHGLNDALELGRKIALVHWKQLESLTTSSVATLPSTQAAAPKKKQKKVETVTVKGAELLQSKGKAIKILWDSRRIWLPKSQVTWDSNTDELTLPTWLARSKNIKAAPTPKPRNETFTGDAAREMLAKIQAYAGHEDGDGSDVDAMFTKLTGIDTNTDDFDFDAWKAGAV